MKVINSPKKEAEFFVRGNDNRHAHRGMVCLRIYRVSTATGNITIR
jgi:hypothetical protein